MTFNIPKKKFVFKWTVSTNEDLYKSCGYILFLDDDKYVPIGLPILDEEIGEFLIQWLLAAVKDTEL